MKLTSIDDEINSLSDKFQRIRVKNHRKSIMDLKPFGSKYQRYQLAARNPVTEKYRELAYLRSPYYFYITLTLKCVVNESHLLVLINKFIHKFNQKLFGRKYDKADNHMEGLAFFEKFRTQQSINIYHVHMLIQDNDEYYNKSFEEHTVNFYEAASKVKNERGNHVFYRKSVDIRPAGDQRRIEYCFEQMNDKNLCRIKIIGENGMSDRLYDF